MVGTPGIPSPFRVSLQVDNGLVIENGGVLPEAASEQVPFNINAIWKAPSSKTVTLSVKVAGTGTVQGNGWESPATMWARLS
jgi:hypothetical protein